MNDLLIYPYRLLDLEVKEIHKIIDNTFVFTLDIIEANLPELIEEIQVKAGGVIISDRTIKAAVEEVDEFTGALLQGFYDKIDDNKWKQGKYRAKKYYLNALNKPSSLVFTDMYDNDKRKGYSTVISLPLFEAIGETCIRIFDYNITKSDQMKYKLKKSDDYYRQKIFRIKRSTSLKYYFIKVLKKYGATDQQLIRNLDTVFGKNEAKAILATNKLPPLYR